MATTATLILGECIERLKEIPDNSIDSVVTDPPSGIAFMGKEWDKFKLAGMTELRAFQEFIKDAFSEVYRVLKPGGHAIVWALPRTSHHTAMGLERAGFDIRDQGTYLFHVFGTGFPKSLDVSKAMDKHFGADREVIGNKADLGIPGYSMTDGKGGLYGQGFGANGTGKGECTITAPATDDAKQWEGWGTGLKPSVEFWILVRKPLEGTVVQNVLKYGTGALNIGESRIATSDNLNGGAYAENPTPRNSDGAWGQDREDADTSFKRGAGEYTQPSGRWPSHLILDESAAEMLDAQSGQSKSSGGSGAKSRGGLGKKAYGKFALDRPIANEGGLGDSGGASRFFYIPKPSVKDKGEFNNHPTVKSTELMLYLCRLVTPPNGTILDPFMGSGSTGVGAEKGGFNFIGIEREPEYLDISRRRMPGCTVITTPSSLP